MKLNVDKFVRLKREHGPLVAFMRDEGDTEWKAWKKEFGFPSEVHALRFKDQYVQLIKDLE